MAVHSKGSRLPHHRPLPTGVQFQLGVDLSLGRMLQNRYVPRLCRRGWPKGWVGQAESGGQFLPLISNEGNRGIRPTCLPRSVFLGKILFTATLRLVKSASKGWAPLKIATGCSSQSRCPDCWLAQLRARRSRAQEVSSETDRGITVSRIQLGVRVDCSQGQIICGSTWQPTVPGQRRFCV